MSRKTHLQEKRGEKLKELNALRNSAEKRSFTAEESGKFDSIEAEIVSINADLAREERSVALAVNIAASKEGSNNEQRRDDSLGLNAKEVRQYSLMKVINALSERRSLDGLELEASQAEARRLGRDPSGFFVPAEVFALGAEKRATNTVTVGPDGGYLVDHTTDYSNMVELLRNQSQVMSLGARTITGLRGDVSIPRVLSGATAYWVSETGQITSTKATFGQISAKPRRLGATTNYTKQLLAQAGLGIENFIRDDIMAAFGVELDRTALNGAGGAEPLGILNLATADRSTSVTFGAAPTWAKVVSFESNVETSNALSNARYAYLTSPSVKGAWKTTTKISGQAAWLWENGDLVNGYAAKSTNQIPSNKVIFGDFSQVIYFEWTGIDLTVDPYTLADQNQVKVTMQKHVDCVVRQGKAFAVSTDAGNQ